MPPHMRSWRDLLNAKGLKSSMRGGARYLFGKRGQRRVALLRTWFRMRITMMLRTGETIGRLARRTEAALWVDGDEAFRRLEKLIRRAHSSILIQMFIWKNDETGRFLARLLLEAAERGVEVEISKEAVGDFFEFHGDFLATRDASEAPWPAFWNHPRIRITHGTFNDHGKVFLIDGSTLLLTGMNIADEYRNRWHDYLVELRGARFVEQFLTRTPPKNRGKRFVELVMNTEEEKHIRPALMGILREAKQLIVLEQCYVSDPDVIDALIAASKRGVKIVIILPRTVDFHHHANQLAIGRLLSEGHGANVTVLVHRDMFHAKATFIDYRVAFIGSANLFKASLDEMGEVNVLIRGHQRVLWKLKEAMRASIYNSRSLSSPPSFLWLSRWLAWLGL